MHYWHTTHLRNVLLFRALQLSFAVADRVQGKEVKKSHQASLSSQPPNGAALFRTVSQRHIGSIHELVNGRKIFPLLRILSYHRVFSVVFLIDTSDLPAGRGRAAGQAQRVRLRPRGQRFRQPDPLLRADALPDGQGPPNREAGGGRVQRAGRRAGRFHRCRSHRGAQQRRRRYGE